MVAISVGNYHVCAVKASGAAYCWGASLQGQVGTGVTGYEIPPSVVTGLSTGVKAVAAGGHHTCAVLESGGVKCWGDNANGQLGDGGTTQKTTPVAVPDLPAGVASLAAGSAHTCALLATGAVKCWGDGVSSKLGSGTLAGSTKPVDVPGLGTDVATLVAGSTANHTCAILKDGTLKCWGQNLYGQIGDGSPITSSPAYVVGFAP